MRPSPSSATLRPLRGAFLALAALSFALVPGARADLVPSATPVAGTPAPPATAPFGSAAPGSAVPPGEAGDASAVEPPAVVEAGTDLQNIQEQLAEVKSALAESQKDNQRIFILLFLALIILIANIILQQRRK